MTPMPGQQKRYTIQQAPSGYWLVIDSYTRQAQAKLLTRAEALKDARRRNAA